MFTTIGESLLPAIAYGDAAGLPFGTWSNKQIVTEVGYVQELHETSNNTYFKGKHAKGTTSDDTHLSEAVMDGIEKAEGFDIDAQAEAHIEAFKAEPKVMHDNQIWPLGWGGSTVHSVRRLIQGISPEHSGEDHGSGNGILMKMAALVLWQASAGIEDEERYDQYDQLTRMTHNSPVAYATTRVHGDVLTALLMRQIKNEELTEVIQDSAAFHDKSAKAGGEVASRLRYLARHPNPDAATILQHTDKKGFYAPETLAIAYGAFLLGRNSLHSSVYCAVNLGGDTDSIASITAAMQVFHTDGKVTWPDDIEFIQDIERLRARASTFSDKVL